MAAIQLNASFPILGSLRVIYSWLYLCWFLLHFESIFLQFSKIPTNFSSINTLRKFLFGNRIESSVGYHFILAKKRRNRKLKWREKVSIITYVYRRHIYMRSIHMWCTCMHARIDVCERMCVYICVRRTAYSRTSMYASTRMYTYSTCRL